MKKQIVIDSAKRKEIIRKFEVSEVTMWSALNYHTHSSKARMLRAAALQRGGVVVGSDGEFETDLDICTYWNSEPRQMVQVFTPRVKVVGDLETGQVEIQLDGKMVKSYNNPLISDMPLIQASAQEIINDLK